ncbi:MAG: CotH kinase family protein, partial [Akkermansiaceae bacterium]|nr:CotH kinase family protein [Akkermansiaceae bacterium]
VTDPEGVAAVSLEYQVVAAGAYVPSHLPLRISNNDIVLKPRSRNSSYDIGWTSVPMLDDGTNGDLVAGDDIFTVTLPAQAHRTLVRYRITVEDGLGLAARVPYPDDESLNFAYFVYDGVPSYARNSPAILQTLPVYHLITRGQDYAQCFAYNGADQINQGSDARFFYNWSGTLVYDGVVYDNISYRLRGANGRYYLQGKRSMRFRLNDGSYFQARDQLGKKYPKMWRTLTTGKGFDNRQTQTFALNEAMSMYLFNKVGVPAPDTHWVHWRVIDGADEAPDQWRGDFHGLNFVLETYDVRFMEAHGMAKGNLYKLINQTNDWQRQQRYQAAFAPSDGSDHNSIENDLDGGDSASYIASRVNMDRWNRWHALAEATRIYDFWPNSNKNMTYYFEPVYSSRNGYKGKLWILPWDTDASWGPTWNNGHDVVYNALFPSYDGGGDSNSTPELWPEYFNTVRELRDLLWQSDQINPLIDEFSAFITPFEAADAARWKGAPADAGSYSGLGGAGTTSFANFAKDMKNFAFVGGSWPGGNVGAGGRAAFLDTLQASNGEGAQLPGTPTITYTGTAGYPTDGLVFQSGNFADPQGVGSFAAMEWRIAEITDPLAPKHDPTRRFKLEWEADWESGGLTTFDQTLVVPTPAVRSGLTYRARVRHKDKTGRWSHWSAPVTFTTTLPDLSPYLAGLVISEVMYHPADPTAAELAAGFTDDDDFEYIELHNVGPVALNLTDLRLTKGVDFDFLGAAITGLAPGEFVLVVSNRAAFEMRYGTGLPIAGEWEPTDKLNNAGEQIKLSFGAGDTIRDFIYDDVAPWPTAADGMGASLTLADPDAVPDHGLAANWHASSAPQGSPGTDDLTGPFAEWMAARGATDPAAPFGSSSLSNLLAYAVGADLTPTPEAALPTLVIVDEGGTAYPALRYRARRDTGDVTCAVEVSDDLVRWQSGGAFTTQVGAPQDNGDGTDTLTVRSLHSVASKPTQFLRLRVALSGVGSGPFEVWMTTHGASDPFAPFGSSSLSNLLAYAVGADLAPTPEVALPAVSIIQEGAASYPALRYRVRRDANDVTYDVEVSNDLVLWQNGGAFTTQAGSPQDNGDGTVTVTVRSLQSLASKPTQFLRLRVSLTP